MNKTITTPIPDPTPPPEAPQNGSVPCEETIEKKTVPDGKKVYPPVPPVELTPHVVLLSTPVAFDYTTVKVDDHKNLLYLQAMGAGSEHDGRILAVWKDKAAYDAAKPKFFKDTGLASSNVLFEGFHLEIYLAEKKWWQRLTLSQIWAGIVTLFLVLGYVGQIREASGWLFGPPVVETSVPPTPTDVLANEPFKLEVAARNVRPLGNCLIKFDSQTVDPTPGLIMDPIAVRSVPEVKPGDKAILPVSGTASHDGLYRVIIKGHATAGLIPSERNFDCTAQVQVWKPLTLARSRRKTVTSGGKLCEVDFELLVGRQYPTGVDAHAELDEVAGVNFIAARFQATDGGNPVQNWDTPGKEVAFLDWHMRDLRPMHRVPFTLVLASVKSLNSDEWDLIVQKISCLFSEAH